MGLAASRPQPAPPGSHWDRLPRELQDAVIDAAGPLTQLVTGWVSAASLSPRQVWADAVSLDWPGDLTKLPTLAGDLACLEGVRSRAMVERLLAAWASRRPPALETLRRTLQVAAVRHRWHDMLDLDAPLKLAAIAAREDAVWLLENLVKVYTSVVLDRATVLMLAAPGQGSVLRWLHKHAPEAHWPRSAIHHAAQAGDVELAVWITRTGHYVRSESALRIAAANGHLPIVVFLFGSEADRTPEETSNAACEAIQSGHLHIAEWLVRNDPKLDLKRVLVSVLRTRRIAYLNWLHSLAPVTFDDEAFPLAAAHGDRRSVEWMQRAGMVRNLPHALEMAAAAGNLDLVRWISDMFGEQLPESLLEIACSVHALDLVLWLVDRPEMQPVIRSHPPLLDAASGSFELDTVQMLYSRGFTCTTLALTNAALGKRPATVRWLLSTFKDTQWDFQAAMGDKSMKTNRGREPDAESEAVIRRHAGHPLHSARRQLRELECVVWLMISAIAVGALTLIIASYFLLRWVFFPLVQPLLFGPAALLYLAGSGR
ncbi:hypothetical protein HK105_202171 [Polyrhizophydium stewartii]|uniref:Ankyrin repeat protein n=1 Tax=Polyrhizophydium stewartii TaxID=2732419 RepID=A0ABR4NFL7_9FUNG